jgi:hypothetical protein
MNLAEGLCLHNAKIEIGFSKQSFKKNKLYKIIIETHFQTPF